MKPFARFAAALTLLVFANALRAADPAAAAKAPFKYVWATAYHVPSEFTTDESGYFSLNEGKDGKVYVGTAAYGRNAYIVEWDPKQPDRPMRAVIDAHKELGLPLTPTGYAAQAKFHTRNFTGPSGKVYVGTKQGYRLDAKDTSRYDGGYVFVYDPSTGKIENLGRPMPWGDKRLGAEETEGQGVIDVVADESRGLIYAVTCEDQHWMVYDTKQKDKGWRELGPKLYAYATTLIDGKGRAYSLTREYSLARYDPASDKVDVIPLTMDGKPFIAPVVDGGKGLDGGWIPTWNLAADGRTAYLVRMSHSELLKIDLGSDETQSLPVSNLGALIGGAGHDSRSSVTIAPDGRVYVTMKVNNDTGFGGGQLHHICRFDPKTGKIDDVGVLAVKNPNFYGLPIGASGATDPATGKQRPWTHGFHQLPDGTLTPLHAHMALVAGQDGSLYATILYPYALLRIEPDQLK